MLPQFLTSVRQSRAFLSYRRYFSGGLAQALPVQCSPSSGGTDSTAELRYRVWTCPVSPGSLWPCPLPLCFPNLSRTLFPRPSYLLGISVALKPLVFASGTFKNSSMDFFWYARVQGDRARIPEDKIRSP